MWKYSQLYSNLRYTINVLPVVTKAKVARAYNVYEKSTWRVLSQLEYLFVFFFPCRTRSRHSAETFSKSEKFKRAHFPRGKSAVMSRMQKHILARSDYYRGRSCLLHHDDKEIGKSNLRKLAKLSANERSSILIPFIKTYRGVRWGTDRVPFTSSDLFSSNQKFADRLMTNVYESLDVASDRDQRNYSSKLIS